MWATACPRSKQVGEADGGREGGRERGPRYTSGSSPHCWVLNVVEGEGVSAGVLSHVIMLVVLLLLLLLLCGCSADSLRNEFLAAYGHQHLLTLTHLERAGVFLFLWGGLPSGAATHIQGPSVQCSCVPHVCLFTKHGCLQSVPPHHLHPAAPILPAQPPLSPLPLPPPQHTTTLSCCVCTQAL